jgi:hypothetical protein
VGELLVYAGLGAGMETGRSVMDADSGERESDGKMAQYLELELAVGYVANSVLNLKIAEEFSAINEEQFSGIKPPSRNSQRARRDRNRGSAGK